MATKQLSIVIQAVDQMSGPTQRATQSAARGFVNVANASEKSAASINKVELGLGKVVGLLSGLAAVAGGVVGLNAVASSLKGTADELDRLGKLSRKLDIPVEDLSALKYAADATGAGFENLAAGIETARKNIVQFVRFGDGKAADVLKNLRTPLTNQDGTVRSARDLIPDLLDEIKTFQQGDQALIVRKLFGDESALLLIRQGTRGLRELTAEAEKFGGIFTKADTDAAERLNDSIQRIQTSLKALKAQLIVELEPALTQAFDAAAAGLARGRPFIRGAGQLVKDLFDADESVQQQAAERLQRIIDKVGDAVSGAAFAGGRLIGEGLLDGLVVVISAAGPRILDALQDTYIDVLRQIKSSPALTAAFGAVAGPTAALQLSTPLVKSIRGQLDEAIRELDQKGPELAAKIEKLKAEVIEQSKGGAFLGYLPSEELPKAESDLKALIDRVETLRTAARNRIVETGTQSRASLSILASNLKANGKDVVDALAPILGIGEELKDSAAGTGARLDAMFKLAYAASGEAAQGVRTLSDAVSEAVGPPEELSQEYRKLVELIRQLDLEARESEAFGRQREAQRIRLVNAIEQERQKLEELGTAADGVRAQFERVSLARLKSFDIETEALTIVESLTDAEEKYRQGLAERAQLVETGSLKQFQATKINTDAANALRDAATASLAQLDAIAARAPEFAANLDEARKKILGVLSASSGRGPRASAGFGGGLSDGFDELVQKAKDFEAQGKNVATTVGDALTSNLGDAIFAAGENFNNLGNIAKNFAAQTVRSIGQVVSQMLALRIVGGLFGGLGFGVNTGGLIVPGGVQRFARGGIVPGPNVNRDIVPAVLTPGEAVLRREAVRSIGVENVAAMNRRGAAALGGVGGGVSISMNVTISGGDTRTMQAEVNSLPRKIVDALRASPALRGDMNAALGGA